MYTHNAWPCIIMPRLRSSLCPASMSRPIRRRFRPGPKAASAQKRCLREAVFYRSTHAYFSVEPRAPSPIFYSRSWIHCYLQTINRIDDGIYTVRTRVSRTDWSMHVYNNNYVSTHHAVHRRRVCCIRFYVRYACIIWCLFFVML